MSPLPAFGFNVSFHSFVKRLARLVSFSGLILVLGLSPAVADSHCQTLVVSGNPEYPPLLWQDRDDPGRLIGVVPALLKEIVEPMGVTAEVRHVGSWARVLHLARAGGVDMVAGAFMTKERFGYMDYILPPILQLPTVVWVPAGKEFVYRHWPDLVGKVGSTLIDNSFGQNFDRYAEKNLTIVPVRSIRQSFLMAQAKRVDYVLYEQLQGEVKLAREGRGRQFTALETPISSEGLFFTFSKNSPCNTREFREAVAAVLYKMVKDGRVDTLVNDYTERYVRGD